MCGYGRRLWRSRRSWQLDWNWSWSLWKAIQIWRGGQGRWRQIGGGRGPLQCKQTVFGWSLGQQWPLIFSKSQCPVWDQLQQLVKTGCEKFALKLHGIFGWSPKRGLVAHLPLWEGDQMGWNFGCKEQCSRLPQYQPFTCHLSVRPWGKWVLHWLGNASPWQWHVLDWPLNRKWFGGKLVFRRNTGWSTPVSPVGIVIMKFAHAIARVLKGMEICAGGGVTFGAGVTALFVASPPAVRSRAPTLLSRGGRNCRIMAASSIPQGIHGLHHGRSCLVVASSYCLMHGWWQANKKHGQKKIIVWRNTVG